MPARYAFDDYPIKITMRARGQRAWSVMEAMDDQIKDMGSGMFCHWLESGPAYTIYVFSDPNTALLFKMMYPEFEEVKPEPPVRYDSLGLPI